MASASTTGCWDAQRVGLARLTRYSASRSVMRSWKSMMRGRCDNNLCCPPGPQGGDGRQGKPALRLVVTALLDGAAADACAEDEAESARQQRQR
eukprot:scaffold3324_cov371-Prasinococcus_capsulatus_cf.AAC.6